MSEEDIALIRHALRLTFNRYYESNPEEAEKYRDVARRVRALGEQAKKPCPSPDPLGEFACVDRSHCWEPCGDLGHSEEHARPVCDVYIRPMKIWPDHQPCTIKYVRRSRLARLLARAKSIVWE